MLSQTRPPAPSVYAGPRLGGASWFRTPGRIRAIAQRRQLLAVFVQKDFDARYAGSVMGVLWTQAYPLMLLGGYSFVFSSIFTNNIPGFPLFLFVVIALYTFFSNSLTLATTSILSNAQLILRIGFPRELLPVSVVCLAFVDLVASHLVIALGAILFHVEPSLTWLALPFIVVLLGAVCIGLALMFSTAAVYLRDVRFFIEVGMLLMLFLTPIFYSEESVPPSFSWLVHYIPLAVAIGAYRHALLNAEWPSLGSWVVLVAAAVLALVAGVELFDRAQRGFPDAL